MWLLQKLEVSVFGVRAAGSFLDKLQELPEIVTLFCCHGIKAQTNPIRRAAAGDDSTEGKAFDPDLAVGNPQADLDLCALAHRAGGLDQASADAGIGKISPDRGWNLIYS